MGLNPDQGPGSRFFNAVVISEFHKNREFIFMHCLRKALYHEMYLYMHSFIRSLISWAVKPQSSEVKWLNVGWTTRVHIPVMVSVFLNHHVQIGHDSPASNVIYRHCGSIPGASRFSEKQRVWNGVHSAPWGQLRSYLKEKIAAPV
jgi:hypothetical protein